MQALPARWKPLILLLCLLVGALVLTTMHTRHSPYTASVGRLVMSVVLPLQQTIGTGLGQVRLLWQNYVNLLQVRQENAHLRVAVARLQEEVHRQHEAAAQAQRLRDLLHFRDVAFPQAVTAAVIGLDPSPWSEAITLNRGSSDAVQQDAVVMTHTGLVGRIMTLAPHYATVLLITDRRSAVDALIQRTRARGIVVGISRRMCALHDVDLHADVQVGDVILSSGLGGVYPKGVRIGTVVAVQPKPYGLFHEIAVQPVVDLATLEEALVLTP